MVKLLSRFIPTLDKHVSDEQLIAFIDGELGARRHTYVQRHLESCWRCRTKRQQMEATIFAVVERRQQLLRPFLPPPPCGEERFIALLDQQIERERRGWKTIFLAELHRFSIESMNPVLASIVVVALAAGVLFLIWQPTSATPSVNDLLRKAQTNEIAAAERAQPGVIYQKLMIRSHSQTLERTVYRDAQKKHLVRAEHLDAPAMRMKQALESVGLNWDMPLSAADYGRWRSAQMHAKDHIRESGDGFVTLVTSSPEGTVSQQSLTLRMSDFHPVNRAIDIRDSDRFEIAELSYASLGWNEVNAELFDASIPKPSITPKPYAALPTLEQLDDAELGARLVLHQLNADTNEQIQITRSQGAIHIGGVVDTIDRKEKLSRKLRQVPDVVPSLVSIEELTAHRKAAHRVTTVQEYSAATEPAPLEKFFRDNSRSVDDLNRNSDQLLSAALAVQRESNALSELLSRFSSTEKLNESARNTLGQLTACHIAGLRSALEVEDKILHGISLSSGNTAQDASPSDISVAHLTFYSARNVALCRELISAGGSSPRPAQLIVTNMLAATAVLNDTLALLASEQEISK